MVCLSLMSSFPQRIHTIPPSSTWKQQEMGLYDLIPTCTQTAKSVCLFWVRWIVVLPTSGRSLILSTLRNVARWQRKQVEPVTIQFASSADFNSGNLVSPILFLLMKFLNDFCRRLFWLKSPTTTSLLMKLKEERKRETKLLLPTMKICSSTTSGMPWSSSFAICPKGLRKLWKNTSSCRNKKFYENATCGYDKQRTKEKWRKLSNSSSRNLQAYKTTEIWQKIWRRSILYCK